MISRRTILAGGVALAALPRHASARTLLVGAGGEFGSLTQAVLSSKPGDRIELAPGRYESTAVVVPHDIEIVAPRGLAELVAPKEIDNQKGILVLRGRVLVEGIRMIGAKVPDLNGAGIRFEGGNLRVRNCSFVEDQDGILATSDDRSTVEVSNCEFISCGAGDGYSHGMYINRIASLKIESCLYRGTHIGHHVKSRARQTEIQRCLFDDGPGGTTSYAIDMPNGGAGDIHDNVMRKSEDASNRTFVNYGGEGKYHDDGSLRVAHNILRSDRHGAVALHNRLQITADFSDNTLVRLGREVEGTAKLRNNSNSQSVPRDAQQIQDGAGLGPAYRRT